MSEPGMQEFKQTPPDHADVFRLQQRINGHRDAMEFMERQAVALRAERFKLTVELDRLRFELAKEADDATFLRGENAKLRAALQSLYDYQNGSPLIKYEREWNEAMRATEAALAQPEDGK